MASEVAQSFDLLKLCGSSSKKAADFEEHEVCATFLSLRVLSESRGMGERRTAFLSRSIFAAHNFALDKEQIQSCRMQIDDVHLPESYRA